MPNVAKIAVPLLLLTAVGVGAFYYLNQQKAPVAAPENAGPKTAAPETPTDPEPKGPQVDTVEQIQQPALEREAASGPLGNSRSDLPQGVRGRVLLPNGQPAANVQVMLMEDAMKDMFAAYLDRKMGKTTPPIASFVTGEDGAFELGVPRPDVKVDLRVISPEHPEMSRTIGKVLAENWIYAGELKLELGVTVQGRVVDAITNAPIVGASVYMETSNSAQLQLATPGHERGIPTSADEGGYFRYTNGPQEGLVNLTAEAPGYASTKILHQRLRMDAPNEFTVKLERGRSITGVVVDESGARIAGATINAIGLSTKTPQNESVRSDEQGEYRFDALHEGPYRLVAEAPRYAKVEKPIVLTDEDIKIVMPNRGGAWLRVYTAENRPVKSYRLSLKRTYPNNPEGIGNVFDFADRNIGPRDYDGDWVLVDGLPSGTFRFQLEHKDHAKTLSPVFEVQDGAEPVQVTAVLTNGATITGTVIDDQGNPVAGATVSSDMNSGLAEGSGLLEIFGGMIPKKHSSKSVRTDKQGRFRLSQLAFADYMVRVSHPTFCEGTAIDIQLVEENQVVDAGVIQLMRGAIVEGMVTVAGQPTGQVKVTISMPNTARNDPLPGAVGSEEQKRAAARMLFSTNSLSAGDGRYAMLKRVPPGTYKINAARQSAQNPFQALLDMKQTERELVIAPGQDRITIDFTLQNN